MRATLVIVLGVVTLPCLWGAEQSVVDEASRKIWEAEIQGRPPGRVLDNWELVEGLVLCKEGGAIDNRLAVFATVAFHGGRKTAVAVEELAITERGLVAMAQNTKGAALSEEEQKRVKKLFEKACKGYGDRGMMPFYGTFFMGAAVSLKRTIGDTEGIRDAVEKIHRVHGWTATVEEGNDLPFEKYKESIDKNIPIILQKDKRYTVAIGYVIVGDKKYLIVADLARTPLEKSGMLYTSQEHEYFQSLAPNDPERISYEHQKSTKDLLVDYTVSSAKPLPAGVTIEEFEKSKYRAIFVYDWRKSLEAWRPDIVEIVGKPKQGRK